jgi:hypothetical protein
MPTNKKPDVPPRTTVNVIVCAFCKFRGQFVRMKPTKAYACVTCLKALGAPRAYALLKLAFESFHHRQPKPIDPLTAESDFRCVIDAALLTTPLVTPSGFPAEGRPADTQAGEV